MSSTVFLIKVSIQQRIKKKRPDSKIRSRNHLIEGQLRLTAIQNLNSWNEVEEEKKKMEVKNPELIFNQLIRICGFNVIG